jgi:hypothetical protein
LDRIVRRFQAILVAMGYNASYSTAVNYMLLGHVSGMTHRGMGPEVIRDLQRFLDDRKITEEMLGDDRMTEYLERSRKRIKERHIT